MTAEPEIILAGRDVEMRNLYWKHVHDSLGHLERYNGRVSRYEVEFDHEVNPRQSKTSHRWRSPAAARAAPCMQRPGEPTSGPLSTARSISWKNSYGVAATADRATSETGGWRLILPGYQTHNHLPTAHPQPSSPAARL